jgi:hypothetical protein
VAPPDRTSAGEPDGIEFDGYLRRAEELLARADGARARARAYRVASQFLPGTVAAVMATLVVAFPSVNLLLGGVVATATAFVGAIATRRRLHVPWQVQTRRDEEAVVEIARLLRDLAPVLAEAEGWPLVRRRVTDARISRFPIGPGDSW